MRNAWATVIRRPGLVVIHPYSQERPGALVGTPPYAILRPDASNEEIGKAAQRALEESRPSVDKPMDAQERLRARYEALRVKSEDDLRTDTQIVGVARKDGNLVVTPTENGGEAREWNFVHLLDQRIVVSEDASALQLGDAIQHGFEKCR
jgi:hypothetical protein